MRTQHGSDLEEVEEAITRTADDITWRVKVLTEMDRSIDPPSSRAEQQILTSISESNEIIAKKWALARAQPGSGLSSTDMIGSESVTASGTLGYQLSKKVPEVK